MRSQKLSRGFTLIELLVVISIIGLLSSVVLASLNTARAKGADAAIKADLSGIRSQAEIYYDDNAGNYAPSATFAEFSCRSTLTGNIFENANIRNAIGHANQQAGGSWGSVTSWYYTRTACAVSQTSYAVVVALKTSTTGAPKSWCIDSSGSSRQLNLTYSDSEVILGDGSGADPYRCP